MPKAPKEEHAPKPDPGLRPVSKRERAPASRYCLKAYQTIGRAFPTPLDLYTSCPLPTVDGEICNAVLTRKTFNFQNQCCGFVCGSEMHQMKTENKRHKLWFTFPQSATADYVPAAPAPATPVRPRGAHVATPPALRTPADVRRRATIVPAASNPTDLQCAKLWCFRRGGSIATTCGDWRAGNTERYCKHHCLETRQGRCDYRDHRLTTSSPARASSDVIEIIDDDEALPSPSSGASSPLRLKAVNGRLAKEGKGSFFGANVIDLTLDWD